MTESKPCALCREPKELCDSHILPELAYRPIYDETRSGLAIDVIAESTEVRQKGFSEYLLCRECEALFNRWETYFARVWLHPRDRKRPKSVNTGLLSIEGLDYSKFKLFHMSVLWRIGESTLPAFKPVRLRSRAEDLRRLLLARDPGAPDSFPFTCIGLRDESTAAWKDDLFHSPQRSRLDGQWIYTILFGGVRWYYFASKHLSGRAHFLPGLSKAGTLTLDVQHWHEDPYIQRDAAKLVAIPKPARPGGATRAI